MSGERKSQSALLPEDRKTLENLVVLYLTQAMLGLVSQNLRAVAADVRPDRLVVHFVFAEDTPADRDDVDDILGDLDALLYNEENLPEEWMIEREIHIGSPDADYWPGQTLRWIYEAKPAAALRLV